MSNIINRFRGDYFFLSNMYPCEIKEKDSVFPSSENFYMYYKCIFNDIEHYIDDGISKDSAKKIFMELWP